MVGGRDFSDHECLQAGWPRPLDLARRQASQRSFGTLAVRKATAVNGSPQLMVRLDCHRLSSRLAACRYKRLDAPGRSDTFGDAPRKNRKAPVAAEHRSDRAAQAAGSVG